MSVLGRLAINDEGFVFDPNTGDSYLLNHSAAAILRGLQQGQDEAAVTDLVMAKFDVERDMAHRDLTDFIGQLKLLHLA